MFGGVRAAAAARTAAGRLHAAKHVSSPPSRRWRHGRQRRRLPRLQQQLLHLRLLHLRLSIVHQHFIHDCCDRATFLPRSDPNRSSNKARGIERSQSQRPTDGSGEGRRLGADCWFTLTQQYALSLSLSLSHVVLSLSLHISGQNDRAFFLRSFFLHRDYYSSLSLSFPALDRESFLSRLCTLA